MIKSFAIKSIGLLLVILLAFSAIALTGCGNSSQKESKSSAISASPKSKNNSSGTSGSSSASDSSKSSANNDGKSSGSSSANNDTKSSGSSSASAPSGSADSDAYAGSYKIPKNAVKGTITVKDYGEIEFALIPDVAPITVENFKALVNSKFYDGLTFHRIMQGFMIQGGDPKGDGTGGNDKKIKGEFSANKVDNPLTHQRGVLSMARAMMPDSAGSQDFNSASSQFFIVQQDSNFLDGQYASFGVVTKGMSVVDKICKDAKPTDGNGTIPKDQQPVIEKITIAG